MHELLEVHEVQWHRTFEGLEEDAIGRIAQLELRVMHEHGAPHAVACTLQLLPHLLPSARGLHSNVKDLFIRHRNADLLCNIRIEGAPTDEVDFRQDL